MLLYASQTLIIFMSSARRFQNKCPCAALCQSNSHYLQCLEHKGSKTCTHMQRHREGEREEREGLNLEPNLCMATSWRSRVRFLSLKTIEWLILVDRLSISGVNFLFWGVKNEKWDCFSLSLSLSLSRSLSGRFFCVLGALCVLFVCIRNARDFPSSHFGVFVLSQWEKERLELLCVACCCYFSIRNPIFFFR